MPYINVNDAYILNNTGKQVDDAVDYALANSNRNLLDNPWFTAGNVVNQRGVATIPNTQYGIDRWKGEHRDATITVTNAGLAYQGTSPDLYQPIESSLRTLLNGKKLTASVLKSDGTIESGSAVFTNGAKTQFIYNSATGADVFISAAGNFNLRYLNRTSAVTVVACKLELGSYSTLANDVPPDYGTELAKCQRYFWRLGGAQYLNIVQSAMAESSSAVFGICRFPVPMRAMPTISPHGAIVALSGISTTTQSISVTLSRNDNSSPTTNPTFVGIKATGSGFTVGQRYDIQIRNDASGYVDFSADL